MNDRMNAPLYYTGTETEAPTSAVEIDVVPRQEYASSYVADSNLAAAVNVAIVLGKPLLLTGEPGTGKTRLAEHVAMALGLNEPERFDTKSTSQATDLFYRFDNLGRFHAASAKREDDKRQAIDFVTLGPLGKAILRTLDPEDPLFALLPQLKSESVRPQRSVVLIDEIDKAPRDFPNDLLDAIDNRRFTFRELEPQVTKDLAKQRREANKGSEEIVAERTLAPVVVITSNSEKNLPDPFLRRCVFYHLLFPTREQLYDIVERRLPPGSGLLKNSAGESQGGSNDRAHPLLRTATTLFFELRGANVRKKPSTAELIDWLHYLLAARASPLQGLTGLRAGLLRQSLGVLVKCDEDLSIATQLIDGGKLATFDGPSG